MYNNKNEIISFNTDLWLMDIDENDKTKKQYINDGKSGYRKNNKWKYVQY